MTAPEEFLDKTRDQGLKELEDFLKIPSISSQPERAADVRRAAGHLAEQYQRIGLGNAEVIETAGHPVVYADWLKAPGKPTVLLYGHYDVQPVDPLDLWKVPPFQPHIETLSGDRKIIVGRGACDDKGQAMTFVEACRAFKAVTGTLPLPITMMIEGEEECGSKHLFEFVKDNAGELMA